MTETTPPDGEEKEPDPIADASTETLISELALRRLTAERIAAAVEREVAARRLEKPLAEQIADAENACNFAESFALKNRLMDEVHASRGPNGY